MNIKNCIIIDDEPYAIEALKGYISSIPNLCVIKSYTDPLEAQIDIVKVDAVDLILLDIEMPKITGIELSKEIRRKTRKLVFTTSYTQYGYEAFEADADGYLLKPYTLTKFTSTILKLFPPTDIVNGGNKTADDYFFVKNRNDNLKIVKIRFRDVIAVESKQNYVLIHTQTRRILTYMSLTEIAKIFRPFQMFEQFQRSFIICKEHIDSIEGNTVQMVNGLQITVGDLYKKDFHRFLSERLIKARRTD